MAMGMERVKTHCRAKMRNASAKEVPSLRKSSSASFFSSASMRNCITADFVASMENSFLALTHTIILQMSDNCNRVYALARDRVETSDKQECVSVYHEHGTGDYINALDAVSGLTPPLHGGRFTIDRHSAKRDCA